MGVLISQLLFQPPRPASYVDDGKGTITWLTCNGKKVKDAAQGGKEVSVQIPSVFLPYKGSDLCIVYSHGNATDLGQMMPYLELLRSQLKINVFGYEYQGYGITKPKVKCSETRCYESIEAAIEHLTTVRNIPTSKIIVFGTSLGTGSSVYICTKHKFRGLVLQSPFTSVVRIKMDVGSNAFFDMFPNVDRIHLVECPVFIIHGKVDEVVPFQHSMTIKEKVQKLYKPLFIDYAGHNNIMEILTVERYIKKLHEFLIYLNTEEKNAQQKASGEGDSSSGDTNGSLIDKSA